MKQKLAFIGAGNMASALIHGLLADGYLAGDIYASDKNATQREKLALLGVHTSDDNVLTASNADIIILAVKPQVLKSVCEQIQATVQQNKPLVISIAAGINENSLSQWLGQTALIRTMPNTPAMVQTGATVLHANEQVNDEQKSVAESIMRAVGITQWLDDETLINAATAISGSGPAYYFLFMETMEKTALKMGLPAETAHLLTLQTALGAARMAMEKSHSLNELRRNVTSPGGTTEAAINSMLDHELPQLFDQAIQQAKEKSIELSQALTQ